MRISVAHVSRDEADELQVQSMNVLELELWIQRRHFSVEQLLYNHAQNIYFHQQTIS